MKTYVMMNKEKTRVRIEHDILPSVLSGRIDLIDEFKPITYEGNIIDKGKAIVGGYVLVEVSYGTIWEDFPECIHGSYEWVYNKITGVVSKVYSPFAKEKLSGVSGTKPFHYHDNNHTTFRFY